MIHKFHNYVKTYTVSKGSIYSHTSLSPPGTYYIPVDKYNEFFTEYHEAYNDGCELSLTEAHRHLSPIVIDLDLKSELRPDQNNHIYTHEHIFHIIDAYCKIISESFHLTKNIDIYLLEKEKYTINKDTIKDGVHIIIPDIITKPSTQYAIRNKVMNDIKDILANVSCTNDIEDIIDEAVIVKNNWMMYGSKKPGNYEYKVTNRYVYNIQDCELHKQDEEERDFTYLLDLFSIRNKYEETNITRFLSKDILEIEEALHKKNENSLILKHITNNREPSNNFSYNDYSGTDLEQVIQLVNILDKKRADNYSDWLRVGWCLKNINEGLVEKWEEFSKNSKKYTSGECKKMWRVMKKQGLGMGTLHMWAKNDNPDGYKDIIKKDISDLIFQSRTGTHNDIARVVYAMYQHEYVCASIKYKAWYEFKNHRWHISDSAYSLRLKISNEIWREYVAAARDWTQKALDTNETDKQQTFQENAKTMSQIALKLKITSFKDNIIKECTEIFYKEGFENALDQNLNLIGFNNGVYDLDTFEFREGRPDDMISFSTNNNYIPYDASNQNIIAIKNYLAQVLVKPNVREYVLKLFSTFLHGAVKEQKFYLWTGSGSNSKSKLVELFEYAYGDYCCKFPITLLTQKRAASNAATSELARAKGKRFACLQEPSEDEKINIGLMKELSGGDKILARAIYKEPVEFKPQFKLLLLCNHLPSVPSDDGGTWRRIRVVEFTSKFVDNPKDENDFPIDLELGEKIEKWKDYFLPMLIEYFKIYKTEGIVEPEEVIKCTIDYKRHNDHLADFIHNCIQKDTQSFLSLNDAFAELKQWTKDDNIPMKIPSKVVLEKYLSRNIGKCVSKNNFKGYKGYKLNNRYEEIEL